VEETEGNKEVREEGPLSKALQRQHSLQGLLHISGIGARVISRAN